MVRNICFVLIEMEMDNFKNQSNFINMIRAEELLPATAPRTPGTPWVHVMSCTFVLVHKGWYF